MEKIYTADVISQYNHTDAKPEIACCTLRGTIISLNILAAELFVKAGIPVLGPYLHANSQHMTCTVVLYILSVM